MKYIKTKEESSLAQGLSKKFGLFFFFGFYATSFIHINLKQLSHHMLA